MMKSMKKLLSIILCLTMVLTMGIMTIPAFAAEDLQTIDAGKGTVQLYYWNFTNNQWVKYGDPITGTAGEKVDYTAFNSLVKTFCEADKRNDLMGLHGATYTFLNTKGNVDSKCNAYYGALSATTWSVTAAATGTSSPATNTNFKYVDGVETPLLVYPTTITVPVRVVNGESKTWKTDTAIEATLAKAKLKSGGTKTVMGDWAPVVTIAKNVNKFADVQLEKTDDQNVIFKDSTGAAITEIAAMAYGKQWSENLLEYPWLFNVNACLESKFPVVINVVSGTTTVQFKSVDDQLKEVLFGFGSEIDLSTCKFTTDGKTAYALSEILSSISDKNANLRGLTIKRLYNGGNQAGNLIKDNNVKFTIADGTDFVNNYKSGDTIALYAETELRQYPIKVMYCTEEFPEIVNSSLGEQPVCTSVLVEKNMTYDKTATIAITDDGLLDALNESTLLDKAQSAVTGWTVDVTRTKAQTFQMKKEVSGVLSIDKGNGYAFNIVYTHDQIPVFIDYNTDYEGQKDKKIEGLGAGFTFHGQDLYETNDNGLIYANVNTISFMTANSYTLDEDGNIKDDNKANNSKNKPGRDYEYLGYEVYFVEGTLTADQVANIDYSKLEPVSKDEEGKLIAEAGTTVVARLLWKNSNDFLLKIYNTKGDLSIALGKNFKLYCWANNKPCKRSEIIKVDDPDKNYVCMYIPGIEKTHCEVIEGVATPTENTKSVFTLTMAMGIKSNLTIEGRFNFYKTLIGTIKNLIG